MSSFQSMVGNFTQEVLYSQLAQLGVPSSNMVRSSLSDESVSSSFQLGSYPQVVSTWPGMSSTGMCSLLYSSRTPAPAFIQPNLATANSFDSRPGGALLAIRFGSELSRFTFSAFQRDTRPLYVFAARFEYRVAQLSWYEFSNEC